AMRLSAAALCPRRSTNDAMATTSERIRKKGPTGTPADRSAVAAPLASCRPALRFDPPVRGAGCLSVKVAQFLVQTRLERGVGRRRIGRGRRLAAPGPPERDDAEQAEAAEADQIRHGPREAVEPLVNRSGQRL